MKRLRSGSGGEVKGSETQDNNGPSSHTLEIPGLWHQSIPAVIEGVLREDPAVMHWHFSPFKQFWNGPSSRPQHIWDELFNSDAWIHEHEAIQSLPRDTGDTEPRACMGTIN